MIYVTIFQDSEQRVRGFESMGHAGFSEKGCDIVCSAVSVLIINTLNSIETFTEDKYDLVSDEEKGFMQVEFFDKLSSEADLLIRSMILGLQTIQNDYNRKYIHVKFKEV